MTKDLPDYTQRLEHERAARVVSMYARSLLATGGHHAAIQDLERRYGRGHTVFELATKALLTPMTTGDAASTALTSLATSTRQFLERIEDRLLQRISGLRRVPMNIRVAVTEVGTYAAWFLAGGPMPATGGSLDLATLAPTQIGTILTASQELVRSNAPEATGLLERDLQSAIATLENDHLLSDAAAIPQLQPAGLLFGLSAVGSSPLTLEADVPVLWGSVRGGNARRPVFFTSPTGAMYLWTARDAAGNRLFPNVGPLGGDIAGVPLLTARAAGSRLILLDAASLCVADAGLTLDVSTVAAIQMTDTPTAGAAALVSAFQDDVAFLRVVRILNWTLGHDDAVGFVDLPQEASPA